MREEGEDIRQKVQCISPMPPLKTVERLETLCSWSIANNLFGVFSSWYSAENNCRIVTEEYISQCVTDTQCASKTNNDIHINLVDEGTSSCEYESWYLNHLTYGAFSDDCSQTLLSPVPEHFVTVSSVTLWLAREVRDFLICYLPPRFHEEILGTVINVIANRTEIPRPKEKIRNYEEDLDFIKKLGFLLSISLHSLLTKGVSNIDFSHVAHLIKKWKLLLWGGETHDRNGIIVESPYFDIFGYSISVSVIGLRTLKQIKLPHFVHNTFVRKIAYLCPNLEVLILRCSADCANPKHNVPVVTNVDVLYGDSVVCPDGQVRFIPGCKDLVILALPEGVETLDVTNDAIEMLAYMPNLEHLVGAPMIYVTEEFEELFETLPGPQKLTNFHHGVYDKNNWPSFVYEDSLQEPNPDYLSRVFSQVTEVSIYAPTEVTENVLKSFSKAENITVFTDDFEVHGKYLKNLRILDINVGYQEEWPILTALSESCPYLEQLTMRSFSLQLSGDTNPKPRFPCLHTLKFHGQNVLQSEALLTVIHGCPQLSTFVLSMITDENGDSQLDDNMLMQVVPMLSNLQKFIYKVQSALRCMDGVPSCVTMKSCKALLASCPQLSYLGQLETWKVTKAEIAMLQEKVRKKNWDLEIA
ncbi:hypothetical protein SK128_011558 [Halocaridina rubra]|uniref:Uncharacterized protein n=1 Tax=Halocaridina rubra TaxID=373956 RepID=A0AAN8X9A3_HALRR